MRLGWLAEIIAAHRCGVAVPSHDAVAFADALTRVVILMVLFCDASILISQHAETSHHRGRGLRA